MAEQKESFDLYNDQMSQKELINTLNNNNDIIISGFNASMQKHSDLFLEKIQKLEKEVVALKIQVGDIDVKLDKIIDFLKTK